MRVCLLTVVTCTEHLEAQYFVQTPTRQVCWRNSYKMATSPEPDPVRKEDGSFKFRTRPRSRTGSGGILRLDISTEPVPPSPQPSVDRLSVTFATEERTGSDASVRLNLYMPGTPPISRMEKVRFPTITDGEDSDEDYSASVTAIMQRRASSRRSRRKGRRTSSPFTPDQDGLQMRRRSSCYTTSSGDTAISMEESLPQEITQEQIFENIRLHKEVLSSVRMQPWIMRRKLKLVQQAKSYIKRHEGVLQERLAQSKSTKDILARWNIYLVQKWQHYRRELANLSNWLIPWESKIKEIESHFGSVVASYFTFLRWLFWVNLIISVVLVAFVAIPELLAFAPTLDDDRKAILPEEKEKATNLFTLWDFEGALKYSPLFYGYYTNNDKNHKGYRHPLAYFMTGLAVYVYSFVATLRKMAENSRMSKLSEKDDECVFSWKLFTGWDYMIGNAETAQNRVASIILSFKEALLEEAEKKREPRNWKIIAGRVLVNLLVILLLGASAYAVVLVVQRSTEPESKRNWWRRNETSVVISLITMIFPNFFEILGFLEHYHPRKQLRLQLARIMALNLLNLYSMIFALFDKIKGMTTELHSLKNITTTDDPLAETCYETFVDCANSSSTYSELSSANLISSVLSNLSLAVLLTNMHLLRNQTDSPFNSTFFENNTLFDQLGLNGYNLSMFASNPAINITEMFNFTYDQDLFNNFNESNEISPGISLEDYWENLNFTSSLENGTQFNDSSTVTSNFSTNNLASSTQFWTDSTELTTVLSKILNTSLEDANDLENATKEIFSTLLPYMNTTDLPLDLSTYLSEIQTTMSSYLPNITSKPTKCLVIQCDPPEDKSNSKTARKASQNYDYAFRKKLRGLCWETLFGQEIVKLTVMDLCLTIINIMIVDFIRAVFVRGMNRCWCWDLEKKFPQYGDFKIAEHILSLVNNQGMVWMGMFFSPGITVINLMKLAVIMYLRSWAVLTCNVPHEVVFRASRSNNFYLALLLTMLFLCVLPVGYAIVWVKPSWHCGPFSEYERIYHIFTTNLKKVLPKGMHQALDYIASPFIVIPLLVLLVLIIYYMISLTNALREANNDLKMQLRRERTEERRKMFQMADRRRRGASGDSVDFENGAFGKWKKLLPMLPNTKSFDTEYSSKGNDIAVEKNNTKTNKDLLVKIIKKAINKSSNDANEHHPAAADDGTDTELHESLPDDVNTREQSSEKNISQENSKKSSRVKRFHEGSISKSTSEDISKPTGSDKPNTVERTRKKDKIQAKYRSTSSSNKDLRQDSITSNWSDNIPVIKISGTGSSECIIEHQNESSPKGKPRITHQAHVDMDTKSEEIPLSELQIAEPQCASSSSETLVTIKMDGEDFLKCEDNGIKRKLGIKEKSSVDTDQSMELQKSSTSDSTQTKTESSSGYRE
ncbi:Transmembrane channel-like [Carabus blaptoides fortunei]